MKKLDMGEGFRSQSDGVPVVRQLSTAHQALGSWHLVKTVGLCSVCPQRKPHRRSPPQLQLVLGILAQLRSSRVGFGNGGQAVQWIPMDSCLGGPFADKNPDVDAERAAALQRFIRLQQAAGAAVPGAELLPFEEGPIKSDKLPPDCIKHHPAMTTIMVRFKNAERGRYLARRDDKVIVLPKDAKFNKDEVAWRVYNETHIEVPGEKRRLICKEIKSKDLSDGIVLAKPADPEDQMLG
eukprot:Skav216353  [mRNA]  locus=scaffold2385:230201:231927:- [translate_table: standard]